MTTSFMQVRLFVLLCTNGTAIKRVDINRLTALRKEIQTTSETAHSFQPFPPRVRKSYLGFLYITKQTAPNITDISDCCTSANAAITPCTSKTVLAISLSNNQISPYYKEDTLFRLLTKLH